MLFEQLPNDTAGAPVTADINRGVRFQKRLHQLNPSLGIGPVFFRASAVKAFPMKDLRQIIGGINNQKINKAGRKMREDRKGISENHAVFYLCKADILFNRDTSAEQRFFFLWCAAERSIPLNFPIGFRQANAPLSYMVQR